MMKSLDTRRGTWRTGCGKAMSMVLLALLMLMTAGAPVLGADAASENSGIALADVNRFTQLLNRLRAEEASRPQVAGLIEHIERYRRIRDEQTSERLESYRSTLEKMGKELADGKLDQALYSAAEAQSLALDKARTLQEPLIRELMDKALAAAAEAEKNSKWLDALAIYRALEALHNQNGTYHDQIKRIGNHVRVLGVYAPERLEQLYTERLERLKNPDEEEFEQPLNLDNEDWVRRLADVQMPMLRQTLVHAARHHIDANGYRPLMLGAVQALRIMVNTPGVENAFSGLQNAEARAAFTRELDTIIDELNRRPGELRYLDVDKYISRIEAASERTVKLPQNVLAYELAEGAVGTLDDYSSVIWPLDLAELYRTLQGNFTGVGILISMRQGKLTVASPLPGGPAINAGIRFDDVIVSVDGESTDKWSLKKAVDRITGPEGTTVELGIKREGVEETLTFKLTRARIKIDSIRGWERTGTDGWNYWIDPELRIGYVRMTQFIPQTADDLDAAIAQMQADGPINGLILDLRFNPGGLLRSAVAVVDRFIPSGLIVSTVDVNGEQQEAHQAGAARTYPRFPVVVLINQGSASASEIVAGALQDYGRAQIVGTRSYGKGSVQDMYHLQGGKALLKLTTQYYRLPKNRIIHRRPKDTTWGVEPDLVVDMPDQKVAAAVRFRQELDVVHVADEALDPNKPLPVASQLLEEGIDPQLDAALLFLKARLVVQDMDLLQPAARGASR